MRIRHIRNDEAALPAGFCRLHDGRVGTHAASKPKPNTLMKTAILIISDPKAGEEALARVFNALAVAAEGKQAGDKVEVSFIGTGTRWPVELTQLSHPANGLYNSVRDLVIGASCGCAAVFGASEGLKACGIEEIKSNALSGTPGLLSLRRYQSEGWQILIF